MNIFYKECPCCGNSIHKCKFLLRSVNHGDIRKKNYKSLYCPYCKRKIMSSYHAGWEIAGGFVVFFIVSLITKYTISHFNFLPVLPFIIKAIPVFLIYFLVILCIIASVLPLHCFKDNDYNIKKNNKLIDNMIVFDESIHITPFEKNTAYKMIRMPFYYFIGVVILLLIAYMFRS